MNNVNELSGAVAPFLASPGGSSSGGWSSFDLHVLLEEDDPLNNDEVIQPNPEVANPVGGAGLPEPHMNSVRAYIKDRLCRSRIGTKKPPVSDEEVERIIDLKNQIFERMAQLNPTNPVWINHRNRLIRDFLQPPRSPEYRIPILEQKLASLWAENATNSPAYRQLIKLGNNFFVNARYRAPVAVGGV